MSEITVACPNWSALAKRRDESPAGEARWDEALEHFDACEHCREAALAAEPTLVFRRLPTLPADRNDIAAMQQSVAAMRRAQPLVGNQRPRRRFASPVMLKAAASVAVLLAASLLFHLTGPGTITPEAPPPVAGIDALLAHEELQFDIQVLSAAQADQDGGTPSASELSPELLAELNNMLRFEQYQVLAQTQVSSQEGEEIQSAFGSGFTVSFEAGSVEADGRLRLEGFKIEKKATSKSGPPMPPQQLFHATLNLRLDRPLTLVVAQDPAHQEALVMAVTCRRRSAR